MKHGRKKRNKKEQEVEEVSEEVVIVTETLSNVMINNVIDNIQFILSLRENIINKKMQSTTECFVASTKKMTFLFYTWESSYARYIAIYVFFFFLFQYTFI